MISILHLQCCALSLCQVGDDATAILHQSLSSRNAITSSHLRITQKGVSRSENEVINVDSEFEQWQDGQKRRVDVKNMPNGVKEVIPRLTVGLKWPTDNECIYFASNSRCTILPFKDRIRHESYFCYCFDNRNFGFKTGQLANADEQGPFDFILKPRTARPSTTAISDTINGRSCKIIKATFANGRTFEIILDTEFDFYPIQVSATATLNGKKYTMKATRTCERDSRSKVVFARSFQEVNTIDGLVSEDMSYTVTHAEFNISIPKDVFTLEGSQLPDGTAISHKNDKDRQIMLVDGNRIRKDGLQAIAERHGRDTKAPPDPVPDRPETQSSGRTWWVVSAISLFVIGIVILLVRRRKGIAT